MSRPHILFAINPKAGNTDKGNLPALIKERSEAKGFDYTLFETTGEKDEEKLRALVEQLSPTILAAAGGDGTCSLAARVVMNTPVKLGIIPAGSANGMARELNIPRDLGAAIDLLVTGTTRTIDLVLVNDKHISMHLSDVGLNAKIIKRFEEENTRGLWGYAKQLWRELFYVRHYHFEINTDGNKIHRTAISITMANASRFGTGAIINPSGKLDDGRFELCIIRPFPFYYLATLIVKFFRGTINNSKYISSISCSKATITCRKKLLLQVDGEVIGKVKEVTAQALPSALMVLVP
jgi:YegS/Rv2252/BmrU family lipid kinase